MPVYSLFFGMNFLNTLYIRQAKRVTKRSNARMRYLVNTRTTTGRHAMTVYGTRVAMSLQ